MQLYRTGVAGLTLLGFVLLFSACGSSGGDGGGAVQGSVALPAIGSIAAVVAAAEAEPYLDGNSLQYYCDCQAGADAGCTPGDDINGDGSRDNPYQTLDAGMTWVDGAADRSLALCRGGSFTTANSGNFIYRINSHDCPVGTICNEVREYPIGGNQPKPLITNPAGSHYLFATGGGSGGWRFMNLRLQGTWDSVNGTNWGFFLYANLGMGALPIHDISIQNLDMDGFDLAIDLATNQNDNILITGNHINNSSRFATLGSCNHLTISYNAFRNNGSGNMFDHTIYVGSHEPVTDMAVVGNYIYGFSTAGDNSNCLGGPIVGHGMFTNLTVSGNTVEEEVTAGPGCWGISFNAGGYPWPTFFRNAIFTDNVIINGGNMPLSVNNAPNVLIANNLIIQQSSGNGGRGIAVPNYQARTPGNSSLGYAEFGGSISGTALRVTTLTSGTIRTGMTLFGTGIAPETTIISGSGNDWAVSTTQTVAETAITGQSCVPGSPSECSDTEETGATVVNNTIYSDVSSTNGMGGGIEVAIEGSGYRVANNSVFYAGSGHQLQGINCFNYSLTPVADHFAFIDNNNCYSNDPIGKWEKTSSSAQLADWQAATGFDRHSTYAPPGWNFTAPLILPTWDDNKTAAQLYADFFMPSGSPLTAAGDHDHAPATDITGTTRPATPSIGAYEP